MKRITLNPEICHGKPCIRNLRYPVELILELLSAGMSSDEILADYADVEVEDILAALVASPSSRALINFRPSTKMQSRFSELLEANRQRLLTPTEDEELDDYVYIDQMISLLKANAYQSLNALPA